MVLVARMQVAAWVGRAEALTAQQQLIGAELNQVRNLQNALLELETSQRGYLLTGKESSLENYIEDQRDFALAAQWLNELAGDQPETLAVIDKIVDLGRARQVELSRSIEQQRNGGFATALALVQADLGYRTMSDFDERVKTLIARLEQTRSAAAAEERAGYHDIRRLGASVILLILLLVGIAVGFQNLVIRRLDELQRQREQEAMHDALTGLPNRRYLAEWLDIELATAKRRGEALTLLYFDLDGFKAVNDRFGHEAGDRVLQAVAAQLRRTMRAGDFVARLGGDEFVAAMPSAPPAAAIIGLMARLQHDLTTVAISELASGAVAASIGVASYPEDGASAQELLQVADRKMYAAKEGRKRLAVAEPSLQPALS
jgi:diguanylate cyclase (GGDEF)-like protein